MRSVNAKRRAGYPYESLFLVKKFRTSFRITSLCSFGGGYKFYDFLKLPICRNYSLFCIPKSWFPLCNHWTMLLVMAPQPSSLPYYCQFTSELERYYYSWIKIIIWGWPFKWVNQAYYKISMMSTVKGCLCLKKIQPRPSQPYIFPVPLESMKSRESHLLETLI